MVTDYPRGGQFRTEQKRELIRRTSDIVRRLRFAPSTCPADFVYEIQKVEEDLVRLETQLATLIDDWMDCQLRKHLARTQPPPETDIHGLSGQWGRRRNAS